MSQQDMPPLPWGRTADDFIRWYAKHDAHDVNVWVEEYARAYAAERVAPLVEALTLIAGTDPADAALDPQRAVRVARAALAAEQEKV